MRGVLLLLALAAPASAQVPDQRGSVLLSPDGQRLMDAFRKESRDAYARNIRERSEAANRARLAVADALSAEPFDAVRLHRAMNEQQSQWTELQRQQTIRQLDLYRQLSPADRRILADRMRGQGRLKTPLPAGHPATR